MKELEKHEYVSSVMTIMPWMKLEREEMGDTIILLVIDDGVYVCICKVYYSVFKEYTHHAFI